MLKRVCLATFTMCLMVVFVGCAENKLTRMNYEMIKENASTKLEVENTLGSPKADRGDHWEYQDLDRSLVVYIHWNEAGKVKDKEWISGAGEGEWEGSAPGIKDEPEGRKTYDGSSTMTIKKE